MAAGRRPAAIHQMPPKKRNTTEPEPASKRKPLSKKLSPDSFFLAARDDDDQEPVKPVKHVSHISEELWLDAADWAKVLRVFATKRKDGFSGINTMGLMCYRSDDLDEFLYFYHISVWSNGKLDQDQWFCAESDEEMMSSTWPEACGRLKGPV